MKLYIVGFGAGNRGNITADAHIAILNSDLVVGYTKYIEIVREFYPQKEYAFTGMKQERQRVELALSEAQTKTVSIVCSGDSQLYAMAGLAYELSVNYPETEIEVIPGVTAAFTGGAVLGSPMTNDFTVISLSDLLTPMEKIRKRLHCAAEGDFVTVIYNPASKKRTDYLEKACDIFLEYRKPDTVCGYVKNIGRENEESEVLTLAELREILADMFTTVFIGNSETKIINGKMVTPRGYKNV